MAQGNNPFWNCNCGCMSKPDVAKFAEQLDAVGGDKGKLTFTSHVPLGLEATTAQGCTYDLGSRPRGVPPVDAVFAHHILTANSFSVVTLVRDVPPALRPDEIEFIMSDITRRFDAMLRNALLGGLPT